MPKNSKEEMNEPVEPIEPVPGGVEDPEEEGIEERAPKGIPDIDADDLGVDEEDDELGDGAAKE